MQSSGYPTVNSNGALGRQSSNLSRQSSNGNGNASYAGSPSSGYAYQGKSSSYRSPPDAGSGQQGRQFIRGAEVRTVPSPAYPTLASALSQAGPPAADCGGSLPSLVVRVLPGVYHERLNITVAAVVLGVGDGIPTIRISGLEGFRITAKHQCVLRRLRLVADAGSRALAVHDSSPLVENCELLGAGGEPAKGAPAGLEVRGAFARPVVRGCRISGHTGSGVLFGAGACGLLAGCDISRCGCGVWIEGNADPLVWRNTIAGHKGAGIVVRADGAGVSMGNAVLRNGAGGILVESARRSRTVISQNRVWANTGLDMRQSPAAKGFLASEAGVLLISNTVGQQTPGPDVNPNTALTANWPKRVVQDAKELVEAVREAPRDRAVLIELVGRIDLEEPLTLDRPVVLCARERGGAELWAHEGLEAAVVIVSGGEASALWWLVIRLQGNMSSHRLRTGASCIDIHAGCPAIMECDLNAACLGEDGESISRDRGITVHAARVSGAGTSPVLAGCNLRGATGIGLLVDRGGSALLLQCEVTKNQKGGVFLGEGASVVLEGCEVRGNGHFGLVAGPHARSAYAGRTTLVENIAGSIWICGGSMEPGDGGSSLPCSPIWLDQCWLGATGGVRGVGSSGPAALVGSGAVSVMWESSFTQQQQQIDDSPSVRVEAGGCAAVAMNGWQPAVPERMMAGNGRMVWLDVSGAGQSPTGNAPPPRPTAASPMPSPALSPASPLPIPPRLYEEEDIRRIAAQEAAAAAATAAEHWMPQRSPQLPPRSPLAQSRSPYPSHAQAQQHRGPRHSDPAHPPRLPQTPGSEHARPQTVPAVPSPPPPESLQRAQTAPERRPMPPSSPTAMPERSMSMLSGTSASAQAEWEAAQAAVAAAMGGSTEGPSISPQPSQSSSPTAAPVQLEPQIGPNGEDRHNHWLRTKSSSKSQELANTEANRRTLYELLSMVCIRNRCQDVLDIVGLGGNMKPNDTVFIRGHTGLWLGVKGEHEIMCNKADRGSACGFVIESKVAALRHGAKIALRIVEQSGGGSRLRLGIAPGGEARVLPRLGGQRDAETQFVIQMLADAQSQVASGMPIMLRSVGVGKNLEVEGEIVRAKTMESGTLQRLVMEKVPLDSEIPPACSDRELPVQEQAWLFRRGVQLALIDKQALAKYLSGHKADRTELLKAYTMIWEAEWRANRPSYSSTGGDDSAAPSPATGKAGPAASQRASSRPRARTMDKLFDMFSGINADDKANGEMFTDALRSFFATALRMSQLEADCVQRVIEAFAAALVNDKTFIEAFTASMLPEKERKSCAYSSPEEVVFGLAYTTMMLNTDAHNQQVAQKMWDTKKFVGAGKDCGCTSGLMMQIFKNVQKEEL